VGDKAEICEVGAKGKAVSPLFHPPQWPPQTVGYSSTATEDGPNRSATAVQNAGALAVAMWMGATRLCGAESDGSDKQDVSDFVV
jgi:hypothetical protein